MDKLIANVWEFQGDDEQSRMDDVIVPTVYEDGTVELMIELVRDKKDGDRNVYVRFRLADLVAIALTAPRQNDD